MYVALQQRRLRGLCSVSGNMVRHGVCFVKGFNGAVNVGDRIGVNMAVQEERTWKQGLEM